MKGKTIWKWMAAALLLGIVCWMFRDSFWDVIQEIKKMNHWLLAVICLCSVGCSCIEGLAFTLLAKNHLKTFSWKAGAGCSYFTSFYRTATIGTGTAAACAYYLYKKGVDASCAVGDATVQYVFQKLAVVVWGGIAFFTERSMLAEHFAKYRRLLLISYALTVVICLFLVLLCVSEAFHTGILTVAQALDRKGRMQKKIWQGEERLQELRKGTLEILAEKKKLFLLLGLEILKLGCWYVIPAVLLSDLSVSPAACIGTAALAATMSGILPAPGGLGTTEAVFVLMFSCLVPQSRAVSAMLLYRFATYMLPCILGGICVFITGKMKAERETDL